MLENDASLLSPGEELPVRADARRNRELLLDTARTLFELSGVVNVSMTAIAEAAEVGKGTLYRHFENKVELCTALLDDEMRMLQEYTFSLLRDETHTALEKLMLFIDAVFSFEIRNEQLLVVEDGVGVSLRHPAHIWWRATALGLLRQMKVTATPEYIADIVYVMLDIRTIRFQRDALGYAQEEIQAGLKQALLKLVS